MDSCTLSLTQYVKKITLLQPTEQSLGRAIPASQPSWVTRGKSDEVQTMTSSHLGGKESDVGFLHAIAVKESSDIEILSYHPLLEIGKRVDPPRRIRLVAGATGLLAAGRQFSQSALVTSGPSQFDGDYSRTRDRRLASRGLDRWQKQTDERTNDRDDH